MKRLWRRPWLSLCSVILSAVLCFLLCYLSSYQQSQKAKLLDTQENFDILCVVTNRRGTQASSLRMGSSAAWFVTDPEGELPKLIRDVQITKEFLITVPLLGISDSTMYGVTNEYCAEQLDPKMGAHVTYFEDGFYKSEEYICLISEEKYNTLDGDTIKIFVKDLFIYPSENEPELGFGNIEMRVVGYYEGDESLIFMPFAASQKLCSTLSNRVSSDSIAFYAVDNKNLSAISDAASEIFGIVDPTASEFSNPRLGLTIHDEQYRATVAALEQNIERTELLLPLVSLLGLGVSFLISFLATRGELLTYALMRTLGMTKGKLFFSVLREQMLVSTLAIALTAIVMQNYLPAVFYLICHFIGCCCAVMRSVSVAPTAILREQE